MDTFGIEHAASILLTSKLLWFALFYVTLELAFAVLIYGYWLPKLNAPRTPPIIRNFEDPNKRHQLFERMLKRQEILCEGLGIPKGPYFIQFMRNWFFVVSGEDDDSLEEDVATEDDEDTEKIKAKKLACIKETGLPCKEDIDRLISWGYFNVNSDELTEEWQKRELAKMYALIKERHGMDPGPKSKQKLQPVQMTLEPLDIKYRPLSIYIVFYICRCVLSVLLYSKGFSYHYSSTGLPYWFRPANKRQNPSSTASQQQHQQPLPFLFFHGIAPGGPSFYVPMIIWSLTTDENTEIDRPVFLFENPVVSFALSDHAPTEQETTEGVWEAVDKHCSSTTDVSMTGHSFGTCLQTYLIHSSQGHRVKQMCLIDPVSIILSDPDVITNFIYCRSHHRDSKLHDSVPEPGAAGYVMNELFIEFFLRRQFAWYNGELFLEDIPEHCKVVVCLSDKDEICNAQKVRAHIDIYNGDTPSLPRCMTHFKKTEEGTTANPPPSGSSLSSNSSASSISLAESCYGGKKNKIDVVYWEGVGHGSCLFDSTAWQELKQAMRKQEREMSKEKIL